MAEGGGRAVRDLIMDPVEGLVTQQVEPQKVGPAPPMQHATDPLLFFLLLLLLFLVLLLFCKTVHWCKLRKEPPLANAVFYLA